MKGIAPQSAACSRTHRRAAAPHTHPAGPPPRMLRVPAAAQQEQHAPSTSSQQQQQRQRTFDYMARLRERAADKNALPLLILAPMENLADRPYRLAHVGTIGGMDEACMEFMRMPNKSERPAASVRGSCSGYDSHELAPYNVPLGAQIMGSNPDILGLAALHLARDKGAPRVDLNCGCPANTVTGNGAGSSLLRTPELLYRCVKAMSDAAGQQTLITVKMRAGYADTSLFQENLLAAQEGGAQFITLHARTKVQTYTGRADWDLIAKACEVLDVPVIGNGDVVSVAAARQLLDTGCQGLCIGRGVVQDPLLFHRIRASFQAPDLPWTWDEPEVVQAFLRAYARETFTWRMRGHPASTRTDPSITNGSTSDGSISSYSSCSSDSECGGASSSGEETSVGGGMSERGKFGRLKKVIKYLFNSTPELATACEHLLRLEPRQGMTSEELVEEVCRHIKEHWPASGPTRLALFNHMTKQAAERVVVVSQTA